MAKEVIAKVKLQCPAGQATPAPPVGPALSSHGVNIGEFVKRFNDATRPQQGMIIPCEITIYKDKKFDIVYKSPPASVLLKKMAALAQGAKTPGHEIVGRVTRAQVREIAKLKVKDLNASDEERACRLIMGTARSMGIEIVES